MILRSVSGINAGMNFYQTNFQKQRFLLLLFSLVLVIVVVRPAQAQEDLPQNLIKQVGFDQKLNAQVPLEITFTDSTGRQVQLADYFGHKPVILSLGYYECPMLCSLVRNGLFESLKALDFSVGEEFELVIVSIDPGETPEVAETKRRASMIEYGRSSTGEGWNFLVGEEPAINQLAAAIGFRYTYDANIEQYVHPSGIVVLTPEGKVSHYFYGIDFPPQDLRLGLVEAAANKIGSVTDQLLLLCYHYDPVSGEYTLFIMNIIRIVGVATVLLIGGALLWLLYRERRNSSPLSPA